MWRSLLEYLGNVGTVPSYNDMLNILSIACEIRTYNLMKNCIFKTSDKQTLYNGHYKYQYLGFLCYFLNELG